MDITEQCSSNSNDIYNNVSDKAKVDEKIENNDRTIPMIER